MVRPSQRRRTSSRRVSVSERTTISAPLFDDLSDVYEAIVDWPARLAREEPFYRDLFARVGARRVVDVACGTGRHAAMFHAWGFEVEAADLSPRMIEHAQAAFGQPPGLRWVVRGFDEPIEPAEPFDVAICVGNSLALAPDRTTAERAVGQMLAAVRPGGAVLVHVLNLWSLPDGPCVWQKCQWAELPQGEVLIVKGVHRSGSRGFVDLVVVPLKRPDRRQTESVPLLGLAREDLQQAARQAGATSAQAFGGYVGEPYDAAVSIDLVLVACR